MITIIAKLLNFIPGNMLFPQEINFRFQMEIRSCFESSLLDPFYFHVITARVFKWADQLVFGNISSWSIDLNSVPKIETHISLSSDIVQCSTRSDKIKNLQSVFLCVIECILNAVECFHYAYERAS